MYKAINYRLRTFAGGRFTNYVRPGSISLLLTYLCNARCVHCDIWKNRRPEDTATAKEWKRLLSDLRSWLGPVHVFITGGEALMQPYAAELVAHGSTIGLAVELLTNGYWKNQTRIEKLVSANPWRVTFSVDGIGKIHNRVRGREDFWNWTSQSIATVRRVREQERLNTEILLKTVVMAQNLESVVEVTRFAADNGLSVFYQPIEQNYNNAEDLRWFDHSPTWPSDTTKAIDVVEQLIAMKRQGLPITNSYDQLKVMIPYFRDPASYQKSVKSHSAHERRQLCAALTSLQVEPNGDVLACSDMPPIGNFRERGIRDIWSDRPRWWKQGCCCSQNPSMSKGDDSASDNSVDSVANDTGDGTS
jgi:MoaA/NifB/PqqE/SkfB family radical SAM enzyme